MITFRLPLPIWRGGGSPFGDPEKPLALVDFLGRGNASHKAKILQLAKLKPKGCALTR